MATNPIAAAVEPYRQQAVERAEERARETIANMRQRVIEADGVLNTIAPRPGPNDFDTYKVKAAIHALYQRLFPLDRDRSPAATSPGESFILSTEPRPKSVDQFIGDAKRDASIQFDAYVAKLTKKAGEVVDASVDGPYIWDESILTVTKPDGSKARWKTTMIVNVSKYGKVFNQFPTRKCK